MLAMNSALRMNTRHVYTNCAWWGGRRRTHIESYVSFVHILIMNVGMNNRACVPTSFAQDCSLAEQSTFLETMVRIMFLEYSPLRIEVGGSRGSLVVEKVRHFTIYRWSFIDTCYTLISIKLVGLFTL